MKPKTRTKPIAKPSPKTDLPLSPAPAADASFKAWAAYYLALGLRPIPVKPGGKFPAVPWKEYQTRQPTLEEFETWEQKGLWQGGVGLVTTDLIVVDCDYAGDPKDLIGDRTFPPTWTVQTGSGGTHFYFRGTRRNATAILQETGRGQVDIRASGGFIVAPPTHHVRTGQPYRWISGPDSLTLADAPGWLLADAPAGKGHPAADPHWVSKALQGVPAGQRNSTANRLGGYMAHKGHPPDIALALLQPFAARCTPPLTDAELQKVVTSTYQTYRRAKSIPADAPQETVPPFPDIAFKGLAAQVADTYHQRMPETPKASLFMAYLTCLGAALDSWVRLADPNGELVTKDNEPRLYTIVVGRTAKTRKSNAINQMIHFFRPLIGEGVTMSVVPASAEGLGKSLQIESNRAILHYDEYSHFVQKASIQNSVLLQFVTSCFHNTWYQNRTTKHPIILNDIHLSKLGACTKETFQRMFAADFTSIGLLNRLFMVLVERPSQQAAVPLEVPPGTVTRLHAQTLSQLLTVIPYGREYIQDADGEYVLDDDGNRVLIITRGQRILRFTPDAYQRWAEWYKALPDSIYADRLDSYGYRLMLLYAVTMRRKAVTLEVVTAVTALLDWQLAVRRELDPIQAESKFARFQLMVARELRKGRMTRREVFKRIHSERYGTWIPKKAMEQLRENGLVGMDQERHCWLTPEGLEWLKGAET